MDRRKPDGGRLGARIFMLIGTIALIIGLWQSVETVRFLGRAVRTTGHVVLRPGETGPMSGAHPTIEFPGPDGKPVRYDQNGMGGRKVGTPIPLLYDPAAPAATATASSFWQLWLPLLLPYWLAFGFIGLPLMGVQVELRGR
ncbi:hypothetical protein ACSBM8_11235 [Sphingomonas sp. ASY06-1R]|uniref:hypothetical protein n=1 Tax=Sphingomonas sp. ASY06-1R TaxID=3445771 RepID=UPI003FA2CBD7